MESNKPPSPFHEEFANLIRQRDRAVHRCVALRQTIRKLQIEMNGQAGYAENRFGVFPKKGLKFELQEANNRNWTATAERDAVKKKFDDTVVQLATVINQLREVDEDRRALKAELLVATNKLKKVTRKSRT